MRSILFSILFLFIPKLAISQTSENDKTVYLDSLWRETTQGNHKYYRIIKDYHSTRKTYIIKDYYKSGVLQMQGTSKTKDGNLKDGEFIFYYENGNKKNISYYDNNGLIGKNTSFYENGNLKEEGEYTDAYKINQFWDENQNHLIIDGNGTYTCTTNGSYESGRYQNGVKDGVFEGKNLKDNSSYSEKYENGNFISGTRTFADNTKTEYFEMEKSASPKKGIKDFYSFIGENFNRTSASIKNNIHGRIIVSFIIDNTGQIVEPTIVRSLGYGLDEEALRVILKYENWIPGEQRGIKVKQKFTIPFSI